MAGALFNTTWCILPRNYSYWDLCTRLFEIHYDLWCLKPMTNCKTSNRLEPIVVAFQSFFWKQHPADCMEPGSRLRERISKKKRQFKMPRTQIWNASTSTPKPSNMHATACNYAKQLHPFPQQITLTPLPKQNEPSQDWAGILWNMKRCRMVFACPAGNWQQFFTTGKSKTKNFGKNLSCYCV